MRVAKIGIFTRRKTSFQEYLPAKEAGCCIMTYADKLISFYENLDPPQRLPEGVGLLFPQKDKKVIEIVKQFLHRFYSENLSRRLIFGINPGRFGAGTTGINFTAPKQLKEFCGIDHLFKPQTELSAEFIYEMILAYGGPEKFYKNYFITSVSPLGFVKDGVNMNYYDDKELLNAVEPFIIDSIKTQISFGFKTDKCFCIGGDKNLKFLSKINGEHQFFREIIPLPHPRFIMQYRRKQKQQFIEQYLNVLS